MEAILRLILAFLVIFFIAMAMLWVLLLLLGLSLLTILSVFIGWLVMVIGGYIWCSKQGVSGDIQKYSGAINIKIRNRKPKWAVNSDQLSIEPTEILLLGPVAIGFISLFWGVREIYGPGNVFGEVIVYLGIPVVSYFLLVVFTKEKVRIATNIGEKLENELERAFVNETKLLNDIITVENDISAIFKQIGFTPDDEIVETHCKKILGSISGKSTNTQKYLEGILKETKHDLQEAQKCYQLLEKVFQHHAAAERFVMASGNATLMEQLDWIKKSLDKKGLQSLMFQRKWTDAKKSFTNIINALEEILAFDGSNSHSSTEQSDDAKTNAAYKILGIHKSDSKPVAKRKYRKLQQKYHPDTSKGNKAFNEEKSKEINAEWDIIKKAKGWT